MSQLSRTGWFQRVVCVGVMVCSAGWSAGQTADEILQQASKALLEAETLRCTLSIRGEGAELFRSTMPVGEAVLLLKRDAPKPEGDAGEPAAAHAEPGWTMRLTGATTSGSAQDKEPIKIDLVLTTDSARWIDESEKKVYQSVPSRALATRSKGYSAARSLVLEEILTPTPFKNEIAATELEVLDPVEIDGITCDVVKITYPTQGNKPGTGRTHQITRVSIGQKDHLVRRIERVSGEGAFSMTIVLELTKVQPGIELTDEQFELPVPDGYTLSESGVRRTTVTANTNNSTRVDTPAVEAPVRSRPESFGPSYPPAPDFSTKDAAGEEISLETLRGHVAVLYFWGTWSTECRPYSPLISKMGDEYAERGVRVIGIAVRERDARAAVEAARAKDYTFTVAPAGNESVVDAFGVVVYPTVAVIDAGGYLVGTQRVRRGSTAADMLAQVQSLIDKALASGEPEPIIDDAQTDQTDDEDPAQDPDPSS